jgi:ABC-2 type transport system permease protein
MIVANAKMTLRNRQALFWMFFFPVLVMGLLGIVFGGGENKSILAIVDKDQTELSKKIIESFEKVEAIKVEKGQEKEEIEKLRKGDLDGVLVIPKNFAAKFPLQPAKVKLFYDPSGRLTSQMMQSTVQSILNQIDRRITNNPSKLIVKSKSLQVKRLDYLDFLLPGILAMAIMTSGVFGMANTLVKYREREILRRLQVTPMPISAFLAAHVVNQLIIAVLQAGIVIAIGYFGFHVKILGSFGLLLLAVIIGALCFATLGFTVSSFASTVETAGTLGNVVTMPMMFLGGVFFPVDTAPNWIQPLIKILPLKYLADALRDVMIRNRSFNAVRSDLIILIIMTIALFIIAAKLFRWESQSKS